MKNYVSNILGKTKSGIEQQEEQMREDVKQSSHNKTEQEVRALSDVVSHHMQEAHHIGKHEERMKQDEEDNLKKVVLLVAGICFINTLLLLQHTGMLSGL